MADEITNRVAKVRGKIEEAAARAGRRADEIRLIAVSKMFDARAIQKAVDAGIHDFGENRVQEALPKMAAVSGDGIRWHLIGHLQSNKARSAAGAFDFIQTVDSVELTNRLDRVAGECGRRLSVLLQVNLSREASKSGAAEQEVREIVLALDRAVNLEFRGLMTIPPFFDSPGLARTFFRQLKDLLETVNEGRLPRLRAPELSMGMSHDFEIAIEEGATMVRIGTAIFGSRA